LNDALAHFESCGYMNVPVMIILLTFFLDKISVDNRSEEARAESQARAKKLIAAWESRHPTRGTNFEEKNNKEKQSQKHWMNPFWMELFVLLERDFQTQFRDVTTIVGLIMQTLIIGLLISFIFSKCLIILLEFKVGSVYYSLFQLIKLLPL
jgi:hypothetical protein